MKGEEKPGPARCGYPPASAWHCWLGAIRRRLVPALLLCLGWTALRAEVLRVKVLPRETDPAIGPDYQQPHTAYVDSGKRLERGAREGRAGGQLLVFLPGTNGSGDRGGEGLCELAARLGYLAVSLTYPTGTSAAEAGAADPDPQAFERFRLALIEGGRFGGWVVSRADSIENRLVRLLVRLHQIRPGDGWDAFLREEGGLRWERIALAGHSQGGGHAVLIGLRHRVARVIATGAPKDFSRRLDAPAAWYRLPSATPKWAFFTFNHVADRQGCTWAQQQRNLAALGLDAFGPGVDVTVERPPYRHARILVTTVPSTTDSRVAHTSVIASTSAARLEPVWTYLLTEPVDGAPPAAADGFSP